MDVNQIIQGDALSVLKSLPDEIVQTCCTSPPYYGLRDYQTETILQLEGDPQDCQHVWIHEGRNEDGAKVAQCQHCFAVKVDRQIGLEETPEAYVSKLVEVFREVKRVLKDDGVLWLNLGDSYASGGKSGEGEVRTVSSKLHASPDNPSLIAQRRVPVPPGMKPKDLIGIPWMVAFALRADGWYLRSDIIWNKPNCMPESVEDRPTKAHEYLFLLSKNERYYYDADAIVESVSFLDRRGNQRIAYAGKGNPETRALSGGATWLGQSPEGTRNKRSVWTINTRSYADAHFATFPPKLIEPCILAGSQRGDIILDPFIGAGTTALVAIQHGRNYLGIELNPSYVQLAEKRIATVQQNLWTSGSEAIAV